MAATELCQVSSCQGLRGGGPHLARHCTSLPGLLVVVGEPGTCLPHSCRVQVGGGEGQDSTDLHGRQEGGHPSVLLPDEGLEIQLQGVHPQMAAGSGGLGRGNGEAPRSEGQGQEGCGGQGAHPA